MNASFRNGRGLTQNVSPADTSKPEPILKEEVYEDVDTILAKAVDDIWQMFDDDGNGLFD